MKAANNNTHPYRTDWNNFDTCCLDVSLFNRYQEGAYLAGAYKWVSARFSDCIINLGDTLHRHNLRHQYATMDDAHEKSRNLGQDWLDNNELCLGALDIPYKIMRSDDWLVDPDFEPVHEAIWEFYYKDSAFQDVIADDIETFVARRTDLPASIVRQSSLAYLLEETAADILLGQRGGVAHLYPGNRHSCYGFLVQNADAIPPLLKGLENSAFKRISPAKTGLRPHELQELGVANENQATAS